MFNINKNNWVSWDVFFPLCKSLGKIGWKHETKPTQGTENEPILRDSTLASSTSGDILKRLIHVAHESERQCTCVGRGMEALGINRSTLMLHFLQSFVPTWTSHKVLFHREWLIQVACNLLTIILALSWFFQYFVFPFTAFIFLFLLPNLCFIDFPLHS